MTATNKGHAKCDRDIVAGKFVQELLQAGFLSLFYQGDYFLKGAVGNGFSDFHFEVATQVLRTCISIPLRYFSFGAVFPGNGRFIDGRFALDNDTIKRNHITRPNLNNLAFTYLFDGYLGAIFQAGNFWRTLQ